MSQTVGPGGASHGLGKAAGSPCEEEHSCQGASAAFYCRDCGTYQCSACETSLHSTRELKLHNREALVSTTRYFRLLVYIYIYMCVSMQYGNETRLHDLCAMSTVMCPVYRPSISHTAESVGSLILSPQCFAFT